MKMTRVFGALLAPLLVMVLATGCTHKEEGIGPAQQAGKAVDEAGAKVADGLRAPLEKADEVSKNAAKRAVERAEEARDHLAERTEHARAQIEDATAEAGRGLEKATSKVGEKVERAGEKMQEAAK